MDNQTTSSDAFLDEVAGQISYRPLRPAVVQELQDHIDDRISGYEEDGLSRSEAEKKAIAGMGDPIVIGTEINAVRHVRSNPILIMLTAILILCGFLSAAYMRWTPEQYVNGYLYYLPGTAILILTSLYSYPLLIRHWRRILHIFLSALLLWVAMAILQNLGWKYGFNRPSYLPIRHLYHIALLLGASLTIAIYYSRNRPDKLIIIFAASAGWILLCSWIARMESAIAVFVISFTGTTLYMMQRKMFSKVRFITVPLVLIIVTFLLLPAQKDTFREFTAPESTTQSRLQDTYNGLLIQELLFRTPTTEGLSLTPEELMDYGIGTWYFGSSYDNHKNIQPPYLHYSKNTVTLWDILPQHYHNNYLIATGIFMFGRLFGAILLAVIGSFFFIIFRCISRIRGQLAACVSVNCALCLLTQTLMYIAGNFGYQYGTFTNLPLISEGRVSIIVNMLLLGFIFSAYRYDKVVDEPISYHTAL
ncbi:MAG: permease prefix domain 1-containing protein [Lachnospiraceae bacterium]